MEKDNFNANVDFVRGQADMIVLSALSDTDKYGLEILSTIQERSQGMYSLKQATLYSSLKRLEKNGYVHSYDGDISNGAKRVYYGLTQMGREHLANDKSYWEFCNFLMSNLISDNKFDPQSEDKPFDPAEFRPLTRRARGEKEDKDDKDIEKEVVVKYVYVKSDDIPEGADVVYVSPDNIQEIENNKSNATVEETSKSESDIENENSGIEEITSLSATSSEYQPSFILVDDEDSIEDLIPEDIENIQNNAEYEEVIGVENQLVILERGFQTVQEDEDNSTTAQLKEQEQEQSVDDVNFQIVDSENQDIDDNSNVAEAEKITETIEEIDDETQAQSDAVVENQDGESIVEETASAPLIAEEAGNAENIQSVIEDNNVIEEVESTSVVEHQNLENEEIIEESKEDIEENLVAQQNFVEDIQATATQAADYDIEKAQYEEQYVSQDSSFANRPIRNAEQDTSNSFASIFSNYSRENDVNYVESFNDLFDIEDEDEIPQQESGADIEFLTMKEMEYKYQAKGINIKPYDKRNTMEYYVNRYYFSNKLQFHSSLMIFAIFAFEFLIAHLICNRGENKASNLWLLLIFAFALFPAIRGVMYVIDPTRKSLANYNPKTSILISLLPVVTLPIVFALIGFVQFGANINDYMSMERSIILPSVLLFNVPLYSIIYTLLYRTYKYHVN